MQTFCAASATGGQKELKNNECFDLSIHGRVDAAPVRTVIGSNGQPRRFLLTQPPGFRKGGDARPAVDALARDTERALRRSDAERHDRYRSSGAQDITTR